jgi:hypothetical protein
MRPAFDAKRSLRRGQSAVACALLLSDPHRAGASGFDSRASKAEPATKGAGLT